MRTPRIAKTGAALFFVALLAAPLAIQRWSAPEAGPVDRQAALERYGFYLKDVAHTAGIDFTHRRPTLDPKLAPIMPEVAAMGASVSVVDFDRDGWQDLYVTNSARGSKNVLYRNQGDGTFENVAGVMGVAKVNQTGTGVSMGAVWGDYDNDGYEDLFLYKWGRPELLHNDAGKGFTRVTEQARLPAWANANTAVWFDYDRDGLLDLFMGGYYPADVDLWHLKTTRIMPGSFEYAQNGGRNYLFHNLGDGAFEEVASEMGLTAQRWTLAAAAADLRGTGYPDLVVANDFGVDEVLLNEKGQHFRAAGEATGVGFAPKSGMNVTYGDVLNEGAFAIYVSNISEAGILIQGNNLWVPRGAAPEGIPQYENLASALNVELGGWSYGAQFGDFNNDGWQDLYLANGQYSGEESTSYWYDFSKVAGGNRAIIADAKNWPAMRGRSLAGYQRDRVWVNDGTGRFQEVAQAVGSGSAYDGRAVVLADLWNRGVLDVIVANQGGPLQVFKNTAAPANHWIAFDLKGTASNRSAIGAEVRLFWDGKQQVQQVSGGNGFSAQNQRRLHFGLGAHAAAPEKAVVHWPSGTVQTLRAPGIDTVHTIRELR